MGKQWITNVTNYQPGSAEYYIDYVLPRVLPWAVSFLAVALVLFLGFVIWLDNNRCLLLLFTPLFLPHSLLCQSATAPTTPPGGSLDACANVLAPRLLQTPYALAASCLAGCTSPCR